MHRQQHVVVGLGVKMAGVVKRGHDLGNNAVELIRVGVGHWGPNQPTTPAFWPVLNARSSARAALNRWMVHSPEQDGPRHARAVR